MILLSVLYDEGEPDTYRGIELHFTSPDFSPEHRDVFNTGVPVHDYLVAIWAVQEVYGDNADVLTRHLSSYNDFAFDGGDLPEEGFTDKQLDDAHRAALLFLGPKYDVNMIQFLAGCLELDDLRKVAEGTGGLYGERKREAEAARKDRLVPMTPDELVAFHKPRSVRLDLNKSKLPRKYTKAIKAMGGWYSYCRGNSSGRHVKLPLTPEGIELGNKLWGEFFIPGSFVPGWGSKNGPPRKGVMVLNTPGDLIPAYKVMRVPRIEDGVQVALDLFAEGIRRGAEAGGVKRMKDPLEAT